MDAQKLGYEKAKQQAKQIYSKIGRIKCPALGGEWSLLKNKLKKSLKEGFFSVLAIS